METEKVINRILRDDDLNTCEKSAELLKLFRESEKEEEPEKEKPKHWSGVFNPKLVPLSPGKDHEPYFGDFYSLNRSGKGVFERDQGKPIINLARRRRQCCETKKEAEFVKRQQAAYLELIDTIQELNKGWRPDWKDGDQEKWEAAYDRRDDIIDIQDSFAVHYLPDWFQGKSEEVWEEAIKQLGKEKVKLALWSIE